MNNALLTGVGPNPFIHQQVGNNDFYKIFIDVI